MSKDLVTTDPVFTDTREAWLGRIVGVWRPIFAKAIDGGFYTLPTRVLPTRVWVSVGRPAQGRWTGACYPGVASDDGNPQIFVNPVISDSTRAAGVVVHQLVHAVFGNRRHDGNFQLFAQRVGLIGKPTATIEGPLFLQLMPMILARYGPYPQPALRQMRHLDPKPPQNRHLLTRCLGCGYQVRVTRKWLAVAAPICPNPKCSERGRAMEIEPHEGYPDPRSRPWK
jgi:hypothetical protein